MEKKKKKLRRVAALFVDDKKGGAYVNVKSVDVWGVSRDARKYEGPHPVVAHPPCTAWCRLAGLVEARWGHKKGEDGGCFRSALDSVRSYGGVLEHPAFSDAFPAFDLPRPPKEGGWIRAFCGGWVCQVEQGSYGHPARKKTWLYLYGHPRPPSLIWGESNATAWVSYAVSPSNQKVVSQRIQGGKAAATPPEFRKALVKMARKCRV